MDLTNSTEFVNITFPPVEPNVKYFINIPAAIYTGILSVMGSIGNLIVLYVYIFKCKQSTFNTFIIFLAVFDVVASLIAMPLDVMNMVLPGAFQGCKIVFIGTTNALATGFILLSIAVLRYKGICQPLKRNISVLQARLISLVSLAIALTISWPSAVMVTNMPNELEGGMMVMTCASDGYYKDTIYPLVFNGILFLLFILVFVTLVVLYGIIGRRLWLRKKYGPTLSSKNKTFVKQSSHSSCEGFSQSVSDETIYNKEKDTVYVSNECSTKSSDQNYVRKEKSYSESEKSEQSSKTKETSRSNSSEDSEWSPKSKEANIQIVELELSSNTSSFTTSTQSVSELVSSKKKTKNVSKSQKTFKMLFIVTLTFLLSYVPHLSLMVYENAGSDLDVTPLGESVVGIVIRSFLINSASNPIIYGFCNRMFRDEIGAIFKIKKCLHIT